MNALLAILGVIVRAVLSVLLETREKKKDAIEAATDDDLDADEFFNRKRM